ncbi:MAG: dipeptidase [Planctomycetota bacterium]
MPRRTFVAVALAAAWLLPAQAETDPALRARAERLMRGTPLIDGHNDTPWQYRKRVANQVERLDLTGDTTALDPPMHTDIPRMRAGLVGAQFWSVYIPIRRYGGADGDARTVIEQIDLVHRMAARHPEHLEIALTADDIERIFASGRIASLMGMEGGHSIENSLAVLRATYALGARYMTLTHSLSTTWADSGTDEARAGGLTPFGREVVREMNRIGMMVDLSHVSPETMHDALDVVEAPVIFSHSSARAVCDHPRNVPDDVLRRVTGNAGVVMVTFVPSYLSEPLRQWTEQRRERRRDLARLHPDDLKLIDAEMDKWREANPAPACTLADVADHIDHVRAVAGIDHVGIGSDFDGIGSLPEGLEDVSKYPDLIAELLARGYSDDDVRKVLGRNLLRVMRAVESVADRLADRPPSDALIEQLDRPADEGGDAARGS